MGYFLKCFYNIIISNFSPKDDSSGAESAVSAVPALAPPPRPQVLPESPRVNPFDKSGANVVQPTVDFDQGKS